MEQLELAEGETLTPDKKSSEWRVAALEHLFWVLSRAALALAVVGITWIVEIPVGDFLRLKDAMERVESKEDRWVLQLEAGERTITNARLAVSHFTYLVRLRDQVSTSPHEKERMLVQAAENAEEKVRVLLEAFNYDGPILGFGESEIVGISANIRAGLAETTRDNSSDTLEAKAGLVEHNLQRLEQRIRADRARIEQAVKED